MKILVTGATGFIGSYLVKELVSQGHEVHALVRKQNSKVLGARLVYGDITDGSSLRPLQEYGFEAVFHCAGLVKEKGWKELYRTNVSGTENVCRLAKNCGVKRLVYTSSVSVVSNSLRLKFSKLS